MNTNKMTVKIVRRLGGRMLHIIREHLASEHPEGTAVEDDHEQLQKTIDSMSDDELKELIETKKRRGQKRASSGSSSTPKGTAKGTKKAKSNKKTPNKADKDLFLSLITQNVRKGKQPKRTKGLLTFFGNDNANGSNRSGEPSGRRSNATSAESLSEIDLTLDDGDQQGDQFSSDNNDNIIEFDIE